MSLDPFLLSHLAPSMIWVALGIGAMALPFAFKRAGRKAAESRASFKRVAEGLGGRLETFSGAPSCLAWLDRGRVRFELAGSPEPARVRHEAGAGDELDYTVFTAPVAPGAGLRGLRVRPQGKLDTLGRFAGLQDLRLGNPSIDDAFVIKAEDEHQTAAYLSQPEIQRTLLELKALKGNDHVELRLEGGIFMVLKLTLLEDEGQLRAFTLGAAALYQSIPGAFGLTLTR